MFCCLCKEREANVHITQNQFTGEQTVEKIDLCEDCAKEHGMNDPAGFSLADLLTKKKKKLNRK